jgi:hypothetical protein
MPISIASAQPTTAKMIQKWFQPMPDFSTSATRSRTRRTARACRRGFRSSCPSAEGRRRPVLLALEDDAERGQRDVPTDPDDDGEDVQREIDLVGGRRVPRKTIVPASRRAPATSASVRIGATGLGGRRRFRSRADS